MSAHLRLRAVISLGGCGVLGHKVVHYKALVLILILSTIPHHYHTYNALSFYVLSIICISLLALALIHMNSYNTHTHIHTYTAGTAGGARAGEGCK